MLLSAIVGSRNEKSKQEAALDPPIRRSRSSPGAYRGVKPNPTSTIVSSGCKDWKQIHPPQSSRFPKTLGNRPEKAPLCGESLLVLRHDSLGNNGTEAAGTRFSWPPVLHLFTSALNPGYPRPSNRRFQDSPNRRG